MDFGAPDFQTNPWELLVAGSMSMFNGFESCCLYGVLRYCVGSVYEMNFIFSGAHPPILNTPMVKHAVSSRTKPWFLGGAQYEGNRLNQIWPQRESQFNWPKLRFMLHSLTTSMKNYPKSLLNSAFYVARISDSWLVPGLSNKIPPL